MYQSVHGQNTSVYGEIAQLVGILCDNTASRYNQKDTVQLQLEKMYGKYPKISNTLFHTLLA